MDPHLECLGAHSNSLTNMPEPKKPYRLPGQLVVHPFRGSCPILPIPFPQTAVCIGARDMSREKGGHDVLGNRLLVSIAVANDRRGRKRGQVHCVIPGSWNMEQAQA